MFLVGSAPGMPKHDSIANGWATVLDALGYDLRNSHFEKTPDRVARFMQEWHTKDVEPPTMTVFENKDCDEMVVVGGITFYSMCAHHGLPFFGNATVGYLPDKGIVGLSKIARVIDYFSRRFQVQEQLTTDIVKFLDTKLKPKGVGVVMQAEHLCMSMRGIQKPGHCTTTSAMRGSFKENASTRAELLRILREGK